MDSGAAPDSETGAEKYEKLTQRGPNIGPASATLAQHQADVSCFLRVLVSGSEILFGTGQLTVYRGLADSTVFGKHLSSRGRIRTFYIYRSIGRTGDPYTARYVTNWCFFLVNIFFINFDNKLFFSAHILNKLFFSDFCGDKLVFSIFL